MTTRSLALFACIGLGVALAVTHTACTSNGDSGPSPSDASASGDASVGTETLAIGVSNSLTGGLSGIGAPLHKAWTVAQQYINASGGVLGKQVQFVEKDDATDDSTQTDQGAVVTGVANQLIALGSAGVIGPNGSAQVDTVWQLFQAKHIVEISGTATSVEFETLPNDAGPDQRYFFRTVPADDLQGKALALLASLGPVGAGGLLMDGGPLPASSGSSSGAADSGGATATDGGDDGGEEDAGASGGGAVDAAATSFCTKTALLYYANAYGIPMSQVFKSRYQGSVVADEPITIGQADFTKPITDIHGANPDCLAMILYDTDGDAFLQAYAAAYDIQPGAFPFFIMGTDGVYDSTYLQSGLSSPSASANTTIVEATYGTNPDSNPNDPQNGPNYNFFATLYTLQFPLPPGQTEVDAFASNEFDAAMLLALAIQKAGTATDGTAIRDALLAITAGKGKAHGPGDYTAALEDIKNGQDITYHGASGPCGLDPDTGNTVAGYIIWEVVNGNFVTLQHISADQVQAL